MLAASGEDASLHYELGAVRMQGGRHQAALAPLRRAAELAPKDPQPLLALGYALTQSGDRGSALQAYESALARDPLSQIALFNLGAELSASGEHGAAAERFEQLLSIDPANAAALFGMARAHHAQGDMGRAIALYRELIVRRPDFWQGGSNLLMALVQQGETSPPELLSESRAWAQRLSVVQAPSLAARRPGEPITVGLLSPDLRDHPVARFLEPVLEVLDRERFRLVAYNCNAGGDDMTERLKPRFNDWRDIAGVDDHRAADIVRADHLDIAIDLAGHSANNRLPLLARRIAPVQATWLGYPATTGLEQIDYRFTDPVADPQGTDDWFSETLVRLPRFLCFRPPGTDPGVSPPPSQASGYVTFGSFNTIAKLSEPTIELWASLLRLVPNSRLLLKAHALVDPAAAGLLRRRFHARGVDSAQLDLRPPTRDMTDHLAAYAAVDIALDPTPYNGTTTTCEALWMGLPVVTLAGQCHLDRVGTALLSHAGLSDTIATTPDAYRRIAMDLANDPAGLAERRAAQRHRLQASELCDIAGFTGHFEAAVARVVEPARSAAQAGAPLANVRPGA